MVFGSQSLAYTLSFVGLNELWYKGYERSSFHFFDDSREWLQVDKCGHAYSAYWLSMWGTQMYRWGGFSPTTSAFMGAVGALVAVSSVELLDGFSAHWGASVSDIAANTVGASVFALQQSLLGEQPVLMKYGYFPSRYAVHHTDELGASLPQRLLKDYNAQTYWLSINLRAVSRINILPRWLNVAVGYGADGMTGANAGVGGGGLGSQRHYYLSLDVDWTRMKTSHALLNRLLWAANMVKFPFFSLELQHRRVAMRIR